MAGSSGMIRASAAAMRRRSIAIMEKLDPMTLVLADSNKAVLTLAQINLIRGAWNAVMTTKGPIAIGTCVIHRLTFRNPEIRVFFKNYEFAAKYKNSDMFMKTHAKAVVDLVDNVIKHLEHLEDLSAELIELGRLHARIAGSSMPSKYLDMFAEAFLEFALQIGEKKQRIDDAQKAWMIIVNFIMEKIKQGFVEERKRSKKLPTFLAVPSSSPVD